MRTAAGTPDLSLFCSVTALILLSPLALAAAESPTDAKRAIQAGLPRYDPAAYEKAQAEQAARAVPKNTPAAAPETKAIAATPTTTSVTPDEHILALPKFTVRGRAESIKRLPRIDTVKPVEVDKADPMESVAGRDARLIKKHLSKLEQALNRFPRIFGVSAIALARDAESREQKAAQMNDLASALELQEAAGRDPEEIKQLRAEYTKLYYSGPK